MSCEVRYQMLRPDQIVAKRKECPVVYIPVGTLEWHGLHNAVGADGLQAEGIAIRCAQTGGGLVFPPLYYGETRAEHLKDSCAVDRDMIAEKMGLDPDNFLPDRMPFSATEQVLNYNKLLLHILAEAESLGFKVGVIVAGHYPLIDFSRAAVLQFNKRAYSYKNGMLAWAFVDHLLISHLYENAGDHAGGWETSHMMALYPETVDLSLLPPKGEKLIGTNPKRHPADATAAFGAEIIEASVDIAVQEVRHRLENRALYFGNGCSLAEGLWKKTT